MFLGLCWLGFRNSWIKHQTLVWRRQASPLRIWERLGFEPPGWSQKWANGLERSLSVRSSQQGRWRMCPTLKTLEDLPLFVYLFLKSICSHEAPLGTKPERQTSMNDLIVSRLMWVVSAASLPYSILASGPFDHLRLLKKLAAPVTFEISKPFYFL